MVANLNTIRDIVYNKLVYKTETRSYEDLSELLFGEGNCFNESEVRKRMYGMLRVFNVMDEEKNLGVSNRILCISDAHVPFHLPVDIYKDYKGMVDTLVINGDLLDCFSCSSFPKKFKISLSEELILGRQYIIDIINLVSPNKVVFVMGNHEYRMQRYLNDRLDNDVVCVLPTDPLGQIIDLGFEVDDARNMTKTYYSSIRDVFEDTGLEIIYNGNWYEKVGNVLFVHPLSYSSGMLKTAEKAVNYFLRIDRTFTGLIMSHTHRLGSYTQGGISMYEQGCVCDLNKLDYNNGKLVLPNQNGFMYICLDDNGDIIESKTQTISI